MLTCQRILPCPHTSQTYPLSLPPQPFPVKPVWREWVDGMWVGGDKKIQSQDNATQCSRALCNILHIILKSSPSPFVSSSSSPSSHLSLLSQLNPKMNPSFYYLYRHTLVWMSWLPSDALTLIPKIQTRAFSKSDCARTTPWTSVKMVCNFLLLFVFLLRAAITQQKKSRRPMGWGN